MHLNKYAAIIIAAYLLRCIYYNLPKLAYMSFQQFNATTYL